MEIFTNPLIVAWAALILSNFCWFWTIVLRARAKDIERHLERLSSVLLDATVKHSVDSLEDRDVIKEWISDYWKTARGEK